MKLMVIDDERNIREGIRYSIPWNEIGIENVIDFSNAEDALKEFSRYLPDIIISDIKMDGMTGLDFFEKAKNIKPDLRMIFVSGYADFEYVVQAMRLGAVDYELKPINNGKLMDLVKKIKQEIMLYAKKQEMFTEYEKKTRAKKMFEILDAEEFQKDIQLYFDKIYELNNKMRLIVVLIDVDYYNNADDEIVQGYIEQVICDLQNEVIIKVWEYFAGKCILLVEVNSSYIYTFNTQYIIKRKIEYINSNDHFNLTVSTIISNMTKIECIMDVYHQMEIKLQKKFYKGPASFFLLDEENDNGILDIQEDIERLKEEFLLAFTAMDIQKMEPIFEGFYQIWTSFGTHSETEIKKYIKNLMKEILLQQLKEDNVAIIDIIQFNEEIKNLEFLKDVIKFWRSWIEEYFKQCWRRKNENYSNNINKALKYISKNYRTNISVESISNYINKTPNYFSSLFKKEIGVNFSEYINVLRIKKAKELMENTDMMLSEISDYVGYSNYIYFTQVFKKIEGISPSKSRNYHKNF